MYRKAVVTVFGWMFLSAMSIQSVTAEEEGVKLQEVVVTATKTEKDPKDVTQSVTVITADEIQKSSATTAAEAVRTAAGVLVNDQGTRGSLTTVRLRGTEYAQVLILLDGKRLNSPRDGGFDLSALPVSLDDIERIEIVRGSSSALYGADAVGGVVNIITKKPEKTQTRVDGSVGSHGYDAVSAVNSGRVGGFFYSVSAGRETSDGYRPNSDLAQATAGAKIGYDVAEHSSIELTTNYIGKEIGVPGPTDRPSPLARQTDRETVSSLGYHTRFSREVELKINAYYTRNVLEYADPDLAVDSRHETLTNGEDAQINWLANSWNMITAGVETRRDHVDSTDTGTHSSSLWAIYLQDEISAGEPLIIIVGGRYDAHSVYADQFSPRVSARYLFSGTGTILRASAGKSFRAPTFNDLYWYDPWSHGNPDLKPETAVEYEAGIEQPVGKAAALRLTGFDRRIRDLIKWKYDVLPMYPVNIGKARISGLEAEMTLKPFDRLTWAANYTYLNPVDETEGHIIYGLPRHQVKSSLNLGLAVQTNLYLEGRMVENYVKPGEDAWHYFVMDAKILQTVAFARGLKGEVFIGMKNIFDRNYSVTRSYDLYGAHSGNYPDPPREIFGGASVQF